MHLSEEKKHFRYIRIYRFTFIHRHFGVTGLIGGVNVQNEKIKFMVYGVWFRIFRQQGIVNVKLRFIIVTNLFYLKVESSKNRDRVWRWSLSMWTP